MTGPRVKICGMGGPRDVRVAAEAGADYVGLVLAESPRGLAPAAAADLVWIARELGPAPVGVTVDREPEEVAALADRVGFRVAQLHGGESPEDCDLLREVGLEVWKALRPRSPGELEQEMRRFRDAVDALLLEGWSAERAGGTGTGFPHAWLEEAGRGRPVGRLVLAGGLDAESVGGAVRTVRPDVVDVSSGVETSPGVKDPARVRAFVEAVRAAGRGASADVAGRGAAPDAAGPDAADSPPAAASDREADAGGPS